jgi:tripartite-type tricarboxylate transporter receptor subunit TctC
VKTFEEMGVAGVDSDNWYALFASKGTPADEAERVARRCARARQRGRVKAR